MTKTSKREKLVKVLTEPLTVDLITQYLARLKQPSTIAKTKDQLPFDVQQAFDHWMKRNLWRPTMTRQESGRLGAAKRQLNAVLRKHSLTFDEVAQAMI